MTDEKRPDWSTFDKDATPFEYLKTDTDHEPMEPASVQGNHQRGIAIFIENANGDLVDIEYLCQPCAYVEDWSGNDWPCFDFGDAGAYCRKCGAIIESPR